MPLLRVTAFESENRRPNCRSWGDATEPFVTNQSRTRRSQRRSWWTTQLSPRRHSCSHGVMVRPCRRGWRSVSCFWVSRFAWARSPCIEAGGPRPFPLIRTLSSGGVRCLCVARAAQQAIAWELKITKKREDAPWLLPSSLASPRRGSHPDWGGADLDASKVRMYPCTPAPNST